MITELRISNFYSFGDEQTVIQFYKGGKKPENGYYQYKDKKISLIQGFFGANASGKTNVLRAIEALRHWIQKGVVFEGSQYQVPNFALKNNKPVELGFDVMIGKELYIFDIAISNTNIINESLKIKNLTTGKIKKLYIYDNGNVEIDMYLTGFGDILKFDTNMTQSLISKLVLLKFPQLQELVKQFSSTHYNSVIDSTNFEQESNELIKTGLALLADNEIKGKVVKVLQLFDRSITDCLITTSSAELPNMKKMEINFVHKDFYSHIPLGIESRGTQELFAITLNLITCLQNGGIVVYDEINRYFHPHIQMAIIKLFLDPDLNKNNAQLFFSSHDHQILNELALDQIHIVEKEDGFSTVTKLSQFDNSATRDNITKKYSLGVFGGVPDIIDFKHGLRQVL